MLAAILTAMSRAAAVPVLCLAACGSPAPQLPHPLEYVHAGVDVPSEAQAIRETLERAGWSIEREVRGRSFIAFGARRGERTAVRVATSSGVGLALDSHAEDGRTETLGPIGVDPPPRGDTHDVDGDGNEEIVVRQSQDGRDCLGVFRVSEDGVVRALPWDAGDLPLDACVEALTDADGDGRIEALARLRFPALALEQTPTVEAPLELGGDFRFHALPPSPRFLERARRALAAAVDEAAGVPDAATVYRLAVESAALERVAGSARARQLAAFDDVITRVVLDEALAAQATRARQHIAQRWSEAGE